MLAATILSNAQSVADKVGDAAFDPFVDWLPAINAGVESLYKLMTALDPMLYFTAGAPFTLAGGATGNSIDLSTYTPAVRTLLGIDLNPGASNRSSVRRRNFHARNYAANPNFWFLLSPWAQDRGYEYTGTLLSFFPFENASGTYAVYYRGAPYQFAYPSDTVALDSQLLPYAEYIWQFAARVMLGREDSSYAFVDERMAEIRQEIETAAERDSNDGASIADEEAADLWSPSWL